MFPYKSCSYFSPCYSIAFIALRIPLVSVVLDVHQLSVVRAISFVRQQWAAGIVAGLAYAWLFIATRNLWVAVVAHAVTNSGLGIVVLLTGAWHFW